jgi:hypothetical protein
MYFAEHPLRASMSWKFASACWAVSGALTNTEISPALWRLMCSSRAWLPILRPPFQEAVPNLLKDTPCDPCLPRKPADGKRQKGKDVGSILMGVNMGAA